MCPLLPTDSKKNDWRLLLAQTGHPYRGLQLLCGRLCRGQLAAPDGGGELEGGGSGARNWGGVGEQLAAEGSTGGQRCGGSHGDVNPRGLVN